MCTFPYYGGRPLMAGKKRRRKKKRRTLSRSERTSSTEGSVLQWWLLPRVRICEDPSGLRLHTNGRSSPAGKAAAAAAHRKLHDNYGEETKGNNKGLCGDEHPLEKRQRLMHAKREAQGRDITRERNNTLLLTAPTPELLQRSCTTG